MTGKAAKEDNGLTEKQNAFCRDYVLNGGQREKAAVSAGYGNKGSRTRAWELLQNEHVLSEIQRLTRINLNAYGTQALAVLREIMNNPKASPTVRQAAAASLADRSGFKSPTIIELQVTRSMAEMEDELLTMFITQPESLPEQPEKPQDQRSH